MLPPLLSPHPFFSSFLLFALIVIFFAVPLSWLDDCFSVNSTLTHAFIETISEPIRWYTCRNAVCEEINGGMFPLLSPLLLSPLTSPLLLIFIPFCTSANGEVDGQKLRASVPREARSFEEMKEFSVKFIKEEAELAYLREEVKRMQEEVQKKEKEKKGEEGSCANGLSLANERKRGSDTAGAADRRA